MLFTLVVEADSDEDDDEYGYPGLSQEVPKFNN